MTDEQILLKIRQLVENGDVPPTSPAAWNGSRTG